MEIQAKYAQIKHFQLINMIPLEQFALNKLERCLEQKFAIAHLDPRKQILAVNIQQPPHRPQD
jgi:hypothetical protein